MFISDVFIAYSFKRHPLIFVHTANVFKPCIRLLFASNISFKLGNVKVTAAYTYVWTTDRQNGALIASFYTNHSSASGYSHLSYIFVSLVNKRTVTIYGIRMYTSD